MFPGLLLLGPLINGLRTCNVRGLGHDRYVTIAVSDNREILLFIDD